MQPAFDSPQGNEWLDEAACAELDIRDFFVEAGHVIEDRVLNTCRSCPVRRECVTHAYEREVTGGYFGGMSPGQRRDMTLKEALVFIETDSIKKPAVKGEIQKEEIIIEDDEDFDYR